jgi:non-ribosomal peptide synthase protein (TIGR01720 family)
VPKAVVIARDEGGSLRLVAYLAGAGGQAPTVAELRAFLAERLPDYMIPSAFVLLDALPLTAGGKVDRRALPAPEDAARPDTSASFVAPASAVEEALARIWASLLRLPQVGRNDNFFELGGDSIISIQIVSRAGQEGIRITPRQIFEHPTVSALASVAGTRTTVSAEQGPVTGPVPLTPVQRWWLELGVADASHWNQPSFIEVREPVDVAAMERAVERILSHHDALRLRLHHGPGGFTQTIAPPGEPVPFRRVDLAGVPEAARAAAVKDAATEAQTSLDLAAGPIARVALLDLGEAGQRLLFVVHHLAVDGVSWRILLEDLWSAYGQERRGVRAELPPKTTSFKRWAERLAEHARAEVMKHEEAHWLGLERWSAAALPVDHQRGVADEESTRTVMVSLTAQETDQLLREVPEAYRTQINDVLLTALAQALAGWTGRPSMLVDVEGHGREEIFDDVDLTRTVGWFTVIAPVAIELPAGGGPGAAIKSVKEQLRAVPGRGLGWGLLRYLREGEPIAARLASLPRAEVSFNYLGQVDQTLPEEAPFRWAREPSGPPRSRRAVRRYLVDVTARVMAGRLLVWFGYSENRYRPSTLEALSARFVEALRALVAHCASPEARGLTPSDFQGADLSQDAVDMLVGMVAEDELQ